MTNEQKLTIAKEMLRLAGDGKKRKDNSFKFSQVELANKIGISNATVSNMIGGKWDSISDNMWRKVQTILKIDLEWITAETSNFRLLHELLHTAKKDSLSVGISYDAGVGKSHAYTEFEKYNTNVIYVECKNYWKTKSYVKALLNSVGLDEIGTVEYMIGKFVDHIMGLENPIIIIDQMDKLKDGAFDLFMDMYNDLYRCCSFIVSGVPALKKRMLRGVKNDKIGYREAFSRLNKVFIELEPIRYEDVSVICKANGLIDDDQISIIYNICEGDLRIVRKEVKKYIILKNRESQYA